jgi:hypothetical protein
VLAADQPPDPASRADCRKRHVAALANLCGQVLRRCQAAGLVKLGPGAWEGTKVKAKASQHKAMSSGRMEATEPKLEQEVKSFWEPAAAVDGAEDARYGPDKRGDE